MSLAWLSYFVSKMRGGCSERVHDFIEAAELEPDFLLPGSGTFN